jgi:Ser/Thr protein kinase RdoA (MazF antagonist)
MYGYRYLEGDMLRSLWPTLSDKEKIHICSSIGRFHAKIGKVIDEGMARRSGIVVDKSTDLHPEVVETYRDVIECDGLPSEYKELAIKARAILERTRGAATFQFIHNDAHHENIIIQNKELVGFIDFGDAEYGEVTKEFSRYIRDFPDYFMHIVEAYQTISGNKLSYERLVSNAYICDLACIKESYYSGVASRREQAKRSLQTYRELMQGAR